LQSVASASVVEFDGEALPHCSEDAPSPAAIRARRQRAYSYVPALKISPSCTAQ
jgi:hypothetical protein